MKPSFGLHILRVLFGGFNTCIGKECKKYFLLPIVFFYSDDCIIQLLKAYRIKFQKFAAHVHKDALTCINIPLYQHEANSVLYQLN